MKLSELIASGRVPDMEVDLEENELLLETVVLFRLAIIGGRSGLATVGIYSGNEVDIVVQTGIITCAAQILGQGWMKDD